MKFVMIGFFIFIFGFLGFEAVKSYHQQTYAHDHYKPVDSVVTTSKLVFSTSANTKGGSIRADIGYSYSIGGQPHKAWRYAYVSQDEPAEAMIKRYPLNAHVTAYVDPDNPDEAVLFNEVTPIPQIVFWFLPFPIILLAGWFGYRRLARRVLDAKKNGAAS